MFVPNPQRNGQSGIVLLAKEPVVFHCNHYNRFLQLVVEDCHYIAKSPPNRTLPWSFITK